MRTQPVHSAWEVVELKPLPKLIMYKLANLAEKNEQPLYSFNDFFHKYSLDGN